MIFWLNLNLRLFFSEKFAVAHNFSGILRMISIMASFLYLILFLVNSENFLPVFLFLNLGFAGWGHHFVCKRKYHLIIPPKEYWNEPLAEDFDEIEGHYLHGLIHCNGYGHLLCANGLKNSSKFFGADDSMEFWDRLCSVLKARFVFLREIFGRI